jgi:hypothetical protein
MPIAFSTRIVPTHGDRATRPFLNFGGGIWSSTGVLASVSVPWYIIWASQCGFWCATTVFRIRATPGRSGGGPNLLSLGTPNHIIQSNFGNGRNFATKYVDVTTPNRVCSPQRGSKPCRHAKIASFWPYRRTHRAVVWFAGTKVIRAPSPNPIGHPFRHASRMFPPNERRYGV